MLDYHYLEALEAIIETGSFHRAAAKLHITQSAISQRISSLENGIGAPVILRETPPVPTGVGMQLIHHLREVRMKEKELNLAGSIIESENNWTEITLGANADSAATWFFDAIATELHKRKILLRLIVETDNLVHDLIQRGEAQGCVMGMERALPGCDSFALGSLRYVCVSTPVLKKNRFKRGLTKNNIKETPTVLFDRYDTMHHKFLQKYLGIRKPRFPHHTVNSASGFLSLVRSGLAYGMLPEIQAAEYLESGELVNLAPACYIDHPLYWMYPRRGAQTFRDLWGALKEGAARVLS